MWASRWPVCHFYVVSQLLHPEVVYHRDVKLLIISHKFLRLLLYGEPWTGRMHFPWVTRECALVVGKLTELAHLPSVHHSIMPFFPDMCAIDFFRQNQILRQNLISRTDSPAKSGIRTRLSGKIKYQDKIIRKKIVWQNTYPAKSSISRDLSGKI